MSLRRVKDWLIGAVATLVALLLALGVLWWTVTDPVGGSGAGQSGRAPEERAPTSDRRPPADLGADEVWLADLRLRAGQVVAPGAALRDVRARGRDVVTGPDGLVAARVVVDVTVPFHVVAAELGPDTVVRRAEGGQAQVLRTLEVLGRELRVAATGTVEVRGGRLVVEPRSLDLGGPPLLSEAVAAVVRRLVTVTHDIEGLPPGLVLERVVVRKDGFRAHLRGRDVRLLP